MTYEECFPFNEKRRLQRILSYGRTGRSGLGILSGGRRMAINRQEDGNYFE